MPALIRLTAALLLTAAPAAAQQGFSLREEDGRLTVWEADKPVMTYNFGMQLAPGNPEQYRRSTYVHPLWDPSGRVVTDDFPADHRHHRGLSWMWPSVTVGGEELDLWHIRGIRQHFEGWLGTEAGPEGARVGARNSWRVGDRAVLDEEVWLRVHPAVGQGRAMDVQLTLTPREAIRIGGQTEGNKGYGGVVLRLAPREDTRITTPEGRQAKDSDHQHVPWADQSGRFQGAGEHSGVAVFQHPSNPGHPTAWTLRHYGFVGNAWPGLAGATLEPGKPVTLRYRVWVHGGDAEAGGVEEAYQAYLDQVTR